MPFISPCVSPPSCFYSDRDFGDPGKMTRDCGGEKPHRGQETGFLRVFGWVTINIERNPVSEIFAWGEKPGFYEFFGWVTINIEFFA
ncbi:hypothetical protein QUB60_10055 [Microcoleus sp. A2-C5]|uniref:hypothetical protein n=1 Tax=Microcoleus sp. A2-C2 TaxID=2818530 RepID=UPI002FD1A903